MTPATAWADTLMYVCVCARARHSLDLLLWGSEHPDEVIFRTEAVSLVPLALWVLWCQ